ncbi:beta-lactamase-like protein [Mycena amicta]|nr:beta-lactamase-like protein [Mycena amicta]
MASYRDIGIPLSSSTVIVKVFDTIRAGDHTKIKGPVTGLFAPVLPGHENFGSPIFSFVIEHTATQTRIMFDLGIRKDPQNSAPNIAQLILDAFPFEAADSDIVDLIEANGIPKESVSAVIWSHSHVDHTGDMTRFPSSTNLVVSKDMALSTYETDPHSTLLPSDIAGRKLVKIDFELQIDAFKAHDYFGDGSFYLLNVPGHQLGHVCGLARVTPTTFVLLGGDACHHAGVLRPTGLLHKHFPCPGALLQKTRASVSREHFSSAGSAFDLTARTNPLLHIAEGPQQADPVVAQDSVNKLTAFDGNPDIFVVLAHDSSLLPLFTDKYPVVLNDWKANGWKEKTVWAFLDEENPAFRFDVR